MVLPSHREICDALRAGRLADLGFDAGIAEALEPLSLPLGARLLRASARTCDPPLALHALVPAVAAWAPRRLSSAGLQALAAALATSAAVRRYVRRDARIAQPLLAGQHVRTAKPSVTMRGELRQLRASAATVEAFDTALRRYRIREWVRIVARSQLRQTDTPAILAELSDLADGIIDVTTRVHLRRERSERGPRAGGFATIAQGKLGSRELNVSSDVDLQFIYSHDDEGRSLHARYSEVARRIVQSLAHKSEVGFCYRVDLDLRPEGSKGPISNAIAASERYYEAWGQGWERLALVRARHVGGARWVTDDWARQLRPFVYPRSVSMDLVEETRALLQRVHTERRFGTHGSIDIKRDPGGIRDIELFVHVLQVLHGGHDPGLRHAPVLEALHLLQLRGLLRATEAQNLAAAYAFLRRLENCLQAIDERQTHRLPRDPDAFAMLAAALGTKPPRLLRTLRRYRRAVVRTISPLLVGAESATSYGNLLATPDAQRDNALVELGFAAHEASSQLRALERTVGGPFSEHAPERLRRLAPVLLADMARAPDPDLALQLFVLLCQRIKGHPAYFALFEDESVRHVLMDVLGTSEFLGKALIRYPQLVDWLATFRRSQPLLAGGGVAMHAGAERLRAMLAGQALEDQLSSLRRFKLQEQLRIGLCDLANVMDLTTVLDELTELAESCLATALDLALGQCSPGLGASFVVLGLGSLGAAALGYGADLDLVFLHDDAMPPAQAVRVAQQLIRYVTLPLPGGALYNVDTRLRPSGNQGPLVASAASFIAYHRTQAMLWERQSLLHARPVAGARALGEAVLDALTEVRYPKALPAGAAQEFDRMRRRMAEERRRKGTDIKSSYGGLADIEFTVQYALMRFGHGLAALQTPRLFDAMRALTAGPYLPARCRRPLEPTYLFLKRLETRLRIVHDRAIDAFEPDTRELTSVARRMGYAQPARFLKAHAETMERARSIYKGVVVPGPSRRRQH